MGATPFEFKHGKGQTAFDTFLHDNKNKETNFKISSTRERERERGHVWDVHAFEETATN